MRSIDRSEIHTSSPSSKVATVRGKRYATDPLYWPALLSQHSRNKKYTIDKIIRQPRPRRSNTVEMKSCTPVLDSRYSSSFFLLLHTSVLHTTICAWAYQAVKFSHPSPNRHGYRNMASCKSVYHILSPENSENDYTPVSRPSYEKCGTRAVVHRTKHAMCM